MVDRLEVRWRLPVALLAGGLLACAAAPRGGAPSVDLCAVGTPPTGEGRAGLETAPAAAPIVIGLPGPLDPARAPVPRTEAERLVFAHLYETLVRVTCDGRVEPGLAASWRTEEDGRRWTFTLRRDARDWRGGPVTAADVGSSWLAAQQAPAGEPADRPWARVSRVGVEDSRTLIAELARPVTIGFFAHPALAVRTAAPPSGWPIGTGPYRPLADGWQSTGPGRSLSLAPTAGGAPLELRAVSGDPRNALDEGLDLLVTADPEVIDYASSASGFQTASLAWNRGYLLAARREAPSTPRGTTRRAPSDTAPSAPSDAARPAPSVGPPERATEPVVDIARPPEEALDALARDAVSIEARSALALAESLEACTPVPHGVVSRYRGPADRVPPADARNASLGAGDGEPRIVYPVGDVVARSLAERLVALALDRRSSRAAWLGEAVPGLARPGGQVHAVGLPAADFAVALREGKDAAYLVPVDLMLAERNPCAEAEILFDRAPWLAGAGTAPSGHRPVIVPLVETRATLLLRRGIGGVVVDGRGTLRLEGVRRAPGGAP